MKIFAIYFKVILDGGNDWLYRLRKEYSQKNDLHITLKQPCFIEETEILIIKKTFNDFFVKENIGRIKIALGKVYFDEGCLMTEINDPKIKDIQKKLVDTFKDYKFIEPELENYEKKFIPHITIIQGIDEATAEELRSNVSFVGMNGNIDSVVLSVVNMINPEETRDQKNKTVVKL